MRAIYPGTFDPVTYGHIDIINRASKIFSNLIVAVAENQDKAPLFNVEERIELLNQCLNGYSNVEIKTFNNLLISFAKENESIVIIRGLRAVSDFEFEFQMALMNKKMDSDIETFFMMSDEKYIYLSSRAIKEIAHLKGDISKFVPPAINRKLIEKYQSNK